MTHKVTPCQAKRKSKKAAQASAFTRFRNNPDLGPIIDNLNRSMHRHKPTTIHQLLELFLQLGSNGRQCFMSEETLSKRFGKHWRSISVVVCYLADLGVITKRQRGVNKSNIYELNPVFNKSYVQHQLKPYFGFLKTLSFNLLLLGSFSENNALINVIEKKEELRKIGNYINYFNRSVYGRGGPETMYYGVGDGTSGVQAREVDRRGPGRFVSMSSVLDNIMKPKESHPMQEQNPIKGKYNLSWWDPNDPFKATKEVLNRYGKDPLPTAEEQMSMTLKDHLIEQKIYEMKQKNLTEARHAAEVDVVVQKKENNVTFTATLSEDIPESPSRPAEDSDTDSWARYENSFENDLIWESQDGDDYS